MSEKGEIVVLGFRDPEEADRVLSRLYMLPREYLAGEDAVVVVRDEIGYVHIKQGSDLVKTGAKDGFLTGSLWGTFVGLLFLDPLIGFAVGSALGASTGALAGSLTDYGIDDDFIKSLAETFPNNSSGLFLLFHKAQPEKVLAELSGVKGKVLRTSLSPEQEKRLQEALSGSAP
ncbi:DUF1269 domain-containing protein [Nitrosospira multiformis]|uniref:DUF1269 domain-containing protein n=1 Tax=Nitrosospira multiformis TaxID=1231 RepID=UPI00089589FD|nr:DUF1269 domain-containing protein [Nitrosospira multiformis]SEA04009.1 Uncharacterized membrane protein [Nitrosospira multiformis]